MGRIELIFRHAMACVLAAASGVALGQSPGALLRAESLCLEGRWAEARPLLAEATAGTDQLNPHAWYLLGFVEKELYKASEVGLPDARTRVAALGAFERARALGISGDEAGSLAAAVDYLGRTYFDDAVAVVAGFRAGQDQEVQALFGRYKAARLAADPRADVREEEADLRLLLGQANALLLESVKDDDIGTASATALLERAISHYSEALRLRPGDYRAEYNRAITIYNHGVRQLKRIDPETSLFELMEVQDACVALFERALVPMQAAHALQPERLETLKGLMTVHRALSQLEESERYRVELERVIRMNRGRG
jgi:hypothetical protein